MREKKAVERVISRMCRHVERCKGRAPEGKDLREIERKVRDGAMHAAKRKKDA
ncbi:MAG: hypothetical protein ACE5DW_00695 [Thermodesulfobacteriota bacterium]